MIAIVGWTMLSVAAARGAWWLLVDRPRRREIDVFYDLVLRQERAERLRGRRK